MDTLTNKRFATYTYTCRYSNVPYYYDTLGGRDIYAIGSQMSKDIESVMHEVKETDTLDYLSLKYYGNPTYWWAIAYFNNIQDSFIKLSTKYKVLLIPAIANIKFK